MTLSFISILLLCLLSGVLAFWLFGKFVDWFKDI